MLVPAQVLHSLVELLQTGVDAGGRLYGDHRLLQLAPAPLLEVLRQGGGAAEVLDRELLGLGLLVAAHAQRRGEVSDWRGGGRRQGGEVGCLALHLSLRPGGEQ